MESDEAHGTSKKPLKKGESLREEQSTILNRLKRTKN